MIGLIASRIFRVFAILIALLNSAGAAVLVDANALDGKDGIALVVGNARYQTAPLSNPENDANAIARALDGRGFKVEKLINATRTEMERAIVRFGRRLKKSQTVGLFFYAGHSVQIGGRNYLIPLGTSIEAEDEIRVESVDLEYVLARMGAAANPMNLVILDSCRDNPFGFSSLNVPSGLAPVDAPPGSFIAYATAPGKVAADGSGDNGIYTSHLLRALQLSGLRIEDVFKRVRREVAKQTDGLQVPWESSSLTRNFYFRPEQRTPADASLQTQPKSIETTYWESIRGSRDKAVLRAYLTRYPNGAYSGLAKAKLEELRVLSSGAAPQSSVSFDVAARDGVFVALKTANIRSQPTISSQKIGLLALGEPIKVTGKTEVAGKSWYRIEKTDQTEGFIYATLLAEKGASWFNFNLDPKGFAILLVAVSIGLLLVGFPSVFTLGTSALAFALLGGLLGVFDLNLLGNIPSHFLGTMTDDTLVAAPLFVFMWLLLARSGLDVQLVATVRSMFGSVRGGLAAALLIAGIVLAAITGFVGMTVGTLGLLLLPIMLSAGYAKHLASGATLASASLGYIAPPSIILIILGVVLQSANIESQQLIGNWTVEPVSVADLFAAAVLPGILLLGMYLLWIAIKLRLSPEDCPPPMQIKRQVSRRMVIQSVVAPVVLLLVVLGGIFTGLASPSEAAGIGVIGAILLGGREKRTFPKSRPANPQSLAVVDKAVEDRKRNGAAYEGNAFRYGDGPPLTGAVCLLALIALAAFTDIHVPRDMAINGEMAVFVMACLLTAVFVWGFAISLWRLAILDALVEAMRETVNVSAMIFVAFLAAAVFVLVFRGFDGDDVIAGILAILPGAPMGAVLAVLCTMFLLGLVLDVFSVLLIYVSIVAPLILQMGVNPVWFGVMIILTLQANFMLPPYSFALSRVRAIAPALPRMQGSLQGAIPFVIIQLIGLIVLAIFPEIATWLADLRATP
ncbi:MAG: TRAP transporter large permease subunit [Rhodospirillales bacterium]|nr:TRAP transporter large permease subunit [Rhodospirillales bacterium]